MCWVRERGEDKVTHLCWSSSPTIILFITPHPPLLSPMLSLSLSPHTRRHFPFTSHTHTPTPRGNKHQSLILLHPLHLSKASSSLHSFLLCSTHHTPSPFIHHMPLHKKEVQLTPQPHTPSDKRVFTRTLKDVHTTPQHPPTREVHTLPSYAALLLSSL